MGISKVVTPDDLRKTLPMEPGWYPAEVFDYKEEVTKGSEAKPSDGSMNAIFFFRIIDGDKKGKEFRRYFNEKSLEYGKEFWAVFFGMDKEQGGKLSSEMFRSVPGNGKKYLVYVKKNNAGFDNIESIRPFDQE